MVFTVKLDIYNYFCSLMILTVTNSCVKHFLLILLSVQNLLIKLYKTLFFIVNIASLYILTLNLITFDYIHANIQLSTIVNKFDIRTQQLCRNDDVY